MRPTLVPVAASLLIALGTGPSAAQDATDADRPVAVRRAPAARADSGHEAPVAVRQPRRAEANDGRVPVNAPRPRAIEAALAAEPAAAPDDAVRSQRRGGRGGGSGSGPGGAVSRPREGRPATGTARPRGGGNYARPPATGGGRTPVVVSPYRWYASPYGYYPFGFGLSSYYFDPFWASPLAYGAWGYGGYGGFGYGPGFGPAYGAGYGGGVGWDTGSVRLKVKPRHAEVYVDGYLVGTVNEFDGIFQSLRLEADTHSLEIRADGYEPLTFDIRLLPQRKITYEGELIKR